MPSDEVEVIQTRVFAAGRNGGNPCPVVAVADGLSDGEMQNLARRFSLDTAFILRPRVKDVDIRVRYFVPDHEMGVSGHATIAAITVLLQNKASCPRSLKIATSTGVFEATWIRDGSRYVITLGQNPPIFGSIVEPGLVASVLKIHLNQMVLPRALFRWFQSHEPSCLFPSWTGACWII
jgi:PhzF family phenazine biosynthesis protein